MNLGPRPWSEWVGKLGSAANYGDEEAARLFELAEEQTCAWMIEVGVWRGYTSLVMAAASLRRPDTRVLSVDKWVNSVGRRGPSWDWVASFVDLREFLLTATDAGLLDRIVPFRMDSIRAAEVWPVAAGPAGLIHLDGTHTYDDLMDDIQVWSAHLAPGGLMAVHDYDPAYPDVMKALDELLDSEHWTDQKLTGCLAEMRYIPKPAKET